MATHTLRPDSFTADPPFYGATAFVTKQGSATGLLVDDDNDATRWAYMSSWAGYRSYTAWGLGNLPALPDGERIQGVRVRIRATMAIDIPTESAPHTELFLAGGVPAVLSEVDVHPRGDQEFPGLWYDHEGALWPLAPDGNPWTTASIAALQVAVWMDHYTPQGNITAYPFFLSAIYVDVLTNVAPSTSVVAPSAAQSYTDGVTVADDPAFTSATATFTTADEGLELVSQGRTDMNYADASGSIVLTSATAGFTDDDLGLEVAAGDYLEADAAISEVLDSTRVRLSKPMRQTPRTVNDGLYLRPYAVATYNLVASSNTIALAAPGRDRSFIVISDLGRTISGPGIPDGTVITAVNEYTPGCGYGYSALMSKNATQTLTRVVLTRSGDTVYSATANFTSADVNGSIVGPHIPTNSVITAVIDSKNVRISGTVTGDASFPDKTITIYAPVSAVAFTLRARLAVPSGSTVIARVSATEVTLSQDARASLASQSFVVRGRPEIITDVDRPLVQAAFDDPENDVLTAWHYRIFTSAQWGAATFDADVSPSLYDSDELVPGGRSAEHRVTTALANATNLRVYVQGADPLGYGAWSFVTFTLASVAPTTPTLVSTMPDDSLARVILAYAAGQGVVDDFARADSAVSEGTATTGQVWSPQAGTWGIASGKGRLVTADTRTVADGVTNAQRVVADGVTSGRRQTTDGVTSVARTVTDGATTAARTVTDGVTRAPRTLTDASIPGPTNTMDSPSGNFTSADVDAPMEGPIPPFRVAGASVGTVVSTTRVTNPFNFDYTTVGPLTVVLRGTIVTSATAVFVAGDVGKVISGGSIPAGATIVERLSATKVRISADAGANATGVTLKIGGTTVTSATAVFVAGDVGKPISGGSIPAGAYITARNSATSVEISDGATSTASSVTVTLAGTLITSATAAFTAADVGKAITGGSIPGSTTVAAIRSTSQAIISAAATSSATGVTLTIGTGTTVTSATAAFTGADVGKLITGGSIPAATTVSSVTNATTVVISNPATADATTVTLAIGDSPLKVTSATAAFVAADDGKLISGGSIPAGAYVVAVVSATEVTISAPTTAFATAVSVTIAGQETTVVETGIVDLDNVVTITMGTHAGATVRELDNSNHLSARLSSGLVSLYKRSAGVNTLLASSTASVVVGGVYELLVRAEGRVLTAFLDDVEVVSATLTPGEKATFTGAGYTKAGRWTNADTTARFDNEFIIPSALKVQAERSHDAGVTWTPVRPSAGWVVTGLATLTAYDYEMRRVCPVRYRVKASRGSVAPVYSTPSAARTVRVDTLGDAWLKDPNDPDANVRVVDSPNLESESDEAQSVVYALARADAIVRSSVVRAEHFSSMELYTEDNAAFAAFEALRQRMRSLLYQSCYGDHAETGADQFYLRIGKRQVRRLTTSEGDIANGQRRLVTIDAVEVASPAE